MCNYVTFTAMTRKCQMLMIRKLKLWVIESISERLPIVANLRKSQLAAHPS